MFLFSIMAICTNIFTIKLINKSSLTLKITKILRYNLILYYLDNYKEAAKKERELFISASASEPDCLASNLPETSKISRKRTYINLNESNDSSKSSIKYYFKYLIT